MKRYPIYFLDADETLFDFRKAEREGLRKAFAVHGFPFDEGVLEQYREITLVDIRYLSPERLGKLLDFTDCDVLFLYSSLVLNNSETLK